MRHCIFLEPEKAFAPAGQNGPHFALETPVRNTCHWLIAFAIGHRLKPSYGYADVGRALFNWLTKECIFFREGGYVMRQKGRQDWCNGVIGHAWLIEALVRAETYLGCVGGRTFAEQLYNRHEFRGGVGAWRRFDPLNKKYAIDFTLDHQGWFAAAAGDLGKWDDISKFLSACDRGAFQVRESGRINHLFFASTPKAALLRVAYQIRNMRHPAAIQELEDGYHHYTLLPFARLYTYAPKHPFFKSERFSKALGYLNSDWLAVLTSNKFAFVYNAPGFELPIILAVFSERIGFNWSQLTAVFEQQMAIVSDGFRDFCGRNNPDELTLSARIYELGLFVEYLLNDVK